MSGRGVRGARTQPRSPKSGGLCEPKADGRVPNADGVWRKCALENEWELKYGRCSRPQNQLKRKRCPPSPRRPSQKERATLTFVDAKGRTSKKQTRAARYIQGRYRYGWQARAIRHRHGPSVTLSQRCTRRHILRWNITPSSTHCGRSANRRRMPEVSPPTHVGANLLYLLARTTPQPQAATA